MSVPQLTPLVVGLLISLAQAGQQDSGIVNGREAEPHSRPYMVSVQQENTHICGGFLVNESFVMSAAHCWEKGAILTVVLGAHDLSNRGTFQRIEVKQCKVHPDFNHSTLDSDIMLLQLRTPAKMTKTVQWINLPREDEDVKPGTICSVAGWGDTKTNGPGSPILREVNVTVTARSNCNTTWEGNITPRMMCAGASPENRGFCNGDSGGPLVCHGQAVGVVSFYKGDCDYPNWPNVYIQISKFLPWIKIYVKNV